MKVYISSTYQDLIEYRAAVDRTLRRMGHDVIGMEQYVAEGSKPVERCKADVRTADAYVIIVAWRYGYVPGLNMLPPDKRSITEIELVEAQNNGKPVLAFLLDPEAPWSLNRVDAMGGLMGKISDLSGLQFKVLNQSKDGILQGDRDVLSYISFDKNSIIRKRVDKVSQINN
mgnify:CR=1 FL=1